MRGSGLIDLIMYNDHQIWVAGEGHALTFCCLTEGALGVCVRV